MGDEFQLGLHNFEISNEIWQEDYLQSKNLVAKDAKDDQISIDLLIIINACIAIFITVNLGIYLIFILQQKEIQEALMVKAKKRRMTSKRAAAYTYLKPKKFCQPLFPEPLYDTPPDSHYSKISSNYVYYENADFLGQQQATRRCLTPLPPRLTPGKSLGASDSSHLWLRVRSTPTGNTYSDYRDTGSSQRDISRTTSDSKRLDDSRSSSKQPPSRSDSNQADNGSNRCDSNQADNSNRCDSNQADNGSNRCDSNQADNSSNRCDSDHYSNNSGLSNYGSDNTRDDNLGSDNTSGGNLDSDHHDYVNA